MSSNKRIVKKSNRYYPEYYHNSFFGKFFSGWKRIESEELWLNGMYTTLEKCDLSYSTLKMAKEHFKEN
tara:strand:+ start:140 stop:346 length:207 start_codon:yes stop_codon:yes gene_type:complete